MKHFIVEIIYKAPMEKVNEVVGRHREFLQKGYDEELFLMSGPKAPKTGGIIVARAESIEALDEFLKDDPYRKEGIADYQFIEFSPVKHLNFMGEWVNGV